MIRDTHETTLSIAASGDTTGSLPIAGWALGRIGWPAAFTGTKVTIECQVINGGAWLACCEDGTQLEITYTASESERIPDVAFGCHALRFKSDDTEAAARSITVMLVA